MSYTFTPGGISMKSKNCRIYKAFRTACGHPESRLCPRRRRPVQRREMGMHNVTSCSRSQRQNSRSRKKHNGLQGWQSRPWLPAVSVRRNRIFPFCRKRGRDVPENFIRNLRTTQENTVRQSPALHRRFCYLQAVESHRYV